MKELFTILLLSMGILTFILIISKLGKMAELVINKGVDLKDIVTLLGCMTSPSLILTLPMAFLLSVIVVLGRLSTENEILILKASGVNLRKLFIPVTTLGVVVTMCGLLNSNLLLPRSAELLRTTLINVLKKGISVDDKEGIFNDTINGVVIYIDKVNAQKRTLSGIVVSDDREKDIKYTISAQEGFINIDPNTLDLHFELKNGNLHRWEKTADTYQSVNFADYTFSMNLASMIPANVGGQRNRPDELPWRDVPFVLSHIDADKKYEFLVDFYKGKIAIPCSTLAFILLTVPLGVRRRIEGKFSGILYSLIIFLFYYVLMAFTENAGKAINLPPIVTSFLPNIVIVAMGCYFVRNLNQEDHATISQKLTYYWTHCLEKTQ